MDVGRRDWIGPRVGRPTPGRWPSASTRTCGSRAGRQHARARGLGALPRRAAALADRTALRLRGQHPAERATRRRCDRRAIACAPRYTSPSSTTWPAAATFRSRSPAPVTARTSASSRASCSTGARSSARRWTAGSRCGRSGSARRMGGSRAVPAPCTRWSRSPSSSGPRGAGAWFRACASAGTSAGFGVHPAARGALPGERRPLLPRGCRPRLPLPRLQGALPPVHQRRGRVRRLRQPRPSSRTFHQPHRRHRLDRHSPLRAGPGLLERPPGFHRDPSRAGQRWAAPPVPLCQREPGETYGTELEGGWVLPRARLEPGYAWLGTQDRTTGAPAARPPGAFCARRRHRVRHPDAASDCFRLYTGATPMERDETGNITSERDPFLRFDARLAQRLPWALELALGADNLFDSRPEAWADDVSRQWYVGLTWLRPFALEIAMIHCSPFQSRVRRGLRRGAPCPRPCPTPSPAPRRPPRVSAP